MFNFYKTYFLLCIYIKTDLIIECEEDLFLLSYLSYEYSLLRKKIKMDLVSSKKISLSHEVFCVRTAADLPLCCLVIDVHFNKGKFSAHFFQETIYFQHITNTSP